MGNCTSSGGGGGGNNLPFGNPGGGGGDRDQVWTGNVGFKEYDTVGDAIGQKQAPMSIENAAKGANPYYQPATSEFSENCQRAIVAYEMRRRGYNVTAQPTFPGDDLPQTAYMNPKTGRMYKRYMGAFRNAKTERVDGLRDIENKMKAFGEGSRGALSFGWKGSDSGHVINVEYKNGKLLFIDAQVGQQYKPAELMKAVRKGTVGLTRLDNLRVSSRMKKSVEKAGRRR